MDEGEGDLLKAIIAGDVSKIRHEYIKHLAARMSLVQVEQELLGKK